MENDNINENVLVQNKILSNSEVLDAASRIMERFDEAFKELAK